MERVEELMKKLPPEYQKEVLDFIEFLIEKKVKKVRRKPDFKWAGTLKDLKEKYSSVQLQHEISNLRIYEE